MEANLDREKAKTPIFAFIPVQLIPGKQIQSIPVINHARNWGEAGVHLQRYLTGSNQGHE